MRVNTIQYRSTQGDFIVECCSRSIVRNCFMIVPSLSDRTVFVIIIILSSLEFFCVIKCFNRDL